jgi:hypothetical protein
MCLLFKARRFKDWISSPKRHVLYKGQNDEQCPNYDSYDSCYIIFSSVHILLRCTACQVIYK